jgi:hypothetical protein
MDLESGLFCPRITQNDAKKGVWRFFSPFRVFCVFRGQKNSYNLKTGASAIGGASGWRASV